MGFGIFGKLPQKRDFVAFDIPRNILEPLENWLQSAVAASRNELGREWQDIYLIAPIWRFWGGRDVFGVDCTGAIMPSVDQVGRFFPLTLIYHDDSGNGLLPPTFVYDDEWYGELDARLLQTLESEAVIDAKSLTMGLSQPNEDTEDGKFGFQSIKQINLWRSDSPPVEDIMSNIADADYRAACNGRSFWWTNGGNEFGPMIFSRNGLPDPYLFTNMITGRVD